MSELSGKAKNAAVMKVINHPAFYGVPFDAGRMIAVEEAAQAAFDAVRAEGSAPVSAPLDREGLEKRIAEIIYEHVWARIEVVGGVRHIIYAGMDDAASAILALSQQDQVGLTTPAVLGEPSADALRSGEREALLAEIADLKQSVIAFCGPWAATYARDFGLPKDHLHPTHYDLLERCGARLVDFTRADLPEPPPPAGGVK